MPRSGRAVRSRAALLGLAVGLAGVLAGCGAEPQQTHAPAPRLGGREPSVRFERPPNIVLVVADDLGFGTLGSYGGRQIATPRLDRMAAEGIRFSDFYAGAASCAPSRSALLTGQHTGHTPVRGNTGPGDPDVALPDEAVTMAEVLREAGYATAVIGKWGLGEPGSPGVPLRQGFDSFLGYLDQTLAQNPFPPFLWRDDQRLPLANEVVETDAGEGYRGSYATKKVDYANDLFTDAALEFITAKRTQPFFLYLPYTVPHLNRGAPAGGKAEAPSLAPYEGMPWSEEAKAYAAMITRLDGDVGRLLDRIAEAGLANDTLVLFTSDNGAADATTPRFFAANGRLRGGKFDLYEGGIRVPLIARWPGHVPAGVTSREPAAFWDLMPTFAELAGTRAPAAIDGVSLVPTLLGLPQSEHGVLYWEAAGTKRGLQALRMGPWKAVHFLFAGRVELYDLESDPDEAHDVAGREPDLAATLRDRMRHEHAPSATFPLLPEERGLWYRTLRCGYQLFQAGVRRVSGAAGVER